MTRPDRAEFDQLARALAALLAAWWIHNQRSYGVSMGKARAPPQYDTTANSTRHHDAVRKAAKRR